MPNLLDKEFEAGGLLADKAKTNLTHLDLFDRIINLKINTAYGSYIVRSDYEVIYHNQRLGNMYKNKPVFQNDYYIRKCQYKPSIKVSYKAVTSETTIEMDIAVSNFFLTDDAGERLMTFNYGDFPINSVEIQMGYWGQFKDLPHETKEDLFMFDRPGIDYIRMEQVYTVTTEKLPPDSTICIHGVVGTSTFDTAVNSIKASNYNDALQDMIISKISDKETLLEKVLFQNITRRFIDPASFTGDDETRKREEKNVLDTYKKNGNILSSSTAIKHGVKVYVSEGTKEISKRMQESMFDADGNVIDSVSLYTFDGFSPANAINRILSSININLLFRPLPTGGYIVYTAQEIQGSPNVRLNFIADQKTQEEFQKHGAIHSYYQNILPAVYNIAMNGGLAVVVCPYFFYVHPFDIVHFKSRYTINKTPASYYNYMQVEDFSVIDQTITFATTEDLNEMQMLCLPL